MKFFISFLIVFLAIGFAVAPAVACDHDCGNCSHSDDCNGGDDSERGGDCGDCGDHGDHGDDDDNGGCSGDSCNI